MAKLLVGNNWYDSVSQGQYETDFEALVTSRAHLLFPEFRTVSFKSLIETESDARKPDIALVDKNYRSWWVVEVEMSRHSLQGHVLPQVEVFANGKYGPNHAEYLCEKCPELELEPLIEMIKGAQPRVLVIVDQNCPDWVDPLRQYDAILNVVEIFRSSRNEHILRVNGESPASTPDHVLTTCRLDPLIPRLLKVDSPALLAARGGNNFLIHFAGGVTEWERFGSSDTVWLCPVSRNPLTTNVNYQIVVDEHDQMFFQIEQ